MLKKHPISEFLLGFALFLTLILCWGCGPARPPASHSPSPSEPAEISETSPATPETEWLAIYINGQKSGYVKLTRTPSGDRVTTEVVTLMAMKREQTVTEIKTISTMIETADGTPISIKKTTEGPGMKQTVTGTLMQNGRLRLTTESAGQINSREVEWPKGALMNEGQRLEALRYGLKEGVRYTSTYFDPDLLEAIQVNVQVGKQMSVNLMGQMTRGTRVDLTTRIHDVPLELEMYVDDRMRTLKTISRRMGMNVEMVVCDETVAKETMDPAEIIRATFLKSPIPLTYKQRQNTIQYTISRRSSTESIQLISTDEQITTLQDDKQVVSVSKQNPTKGVPLDQPVESTLADTLKASDWIQSRAPEIITLAKEAKGDATTRQEAAENITQFVFSYINNKNLQVGYASALEVLKSRQGDCTEHALLTAALIRAIGISTRVVFGLVYVEAFADEKDVFGGHAWTQFHDGNQWISLDAAMGRFDTGHIALAISNSGNPADFFKLTEIIGDIDIDSIHVASKK